jgi:hypothetical protein
METDESGLRSRRKAAPAAVVEAEVVAVTTDSWPPYRPVTQRGFSPFVFHCVICGAPFWK